LVFVSRFASVFNSDAPAIEPQGRHLKTSSLCRIDCTSGDKRRTMVATALLSPDGKVGSSCIVISEARVGGRNGRSACCSQSPRVPPGCDKGEPVNETFMIEDIKLKAFGSPTELSSRCPAPEAAMPHLRKMIRRRMSSHYGQKEVQTVRLVNVDNEEIYRWTWFQEQVRREKIGRRRSGRSPNRRRA
jgi:hypothetical protein